MYCACPLFCRPKVNYPTYNLLTVKDNNNGELTRAWIYAAVVVFFKISDGRSAKTTRSSFYILWNLTQYKWNRSSALANQLSNTYKNQCVSIISSQWSDVKLKGALLCPQSSPIRTRWPGPRAHSSTGSLSCPLWKETQWDKKSSRKWGNPESHRPDNQPPPSRPAPGSKPWRLCQRRLSRVKLLWHPVHFSGWR